MGSPQLDVLLSTVAESLDAEFRVDGATQALSAFDGVVSVEEGGAAADGRYYAWRAVSLGDSYGIELESPEGIVHTHSLSYFTAEVVADRYRPARLDGDGVVVATRRGSTPSKASSATRTRPGDDTTADESPGGGDADDAGGRGDTHRDDRDVRESDPDDTREPLDGAGASGGDDAEVLDDGDGAASADTTAAAETGVTADDGAELIRDSHGSVGGDDDDTDGDTDGDTDDGGGAGSERGDTVGDEGAGRGDTVDDRDGTGDGDGPADSGTAPDDGAHAADPTDAEISRLERVATDPTRHELVRQNAIHELAEFGTDAADALATVSASGVGANERTLADELRADLDVDSNSADGADDSDGDDDGTGPAAE